MNIDNRKLLIQERIWKSEHIKDLYLQYMSEQFPKEIVKALPFHIMFNNMSYHNYRHILSMFIFAEDYNIPLTLEQKIAVLFHDASYIPNCKDNEIRSAEIMQVFCKDFIENNSVEKIKEYIIYTSKHLKWFNTPEDACLIMDLDLCSFSFNQDLYLFISDLIRKEYDDIPLDKFKEERNKFLTLFLERESIYRTKTFSSFNKKAIENIQFSIKS